MKNETADLQAIRRLLFATAMVGAVFLLYFARELLIPLALAVFLAFLLSPLVSLLERTRLNRKAAALIVAALTAVVLGLVGWFIVVRAADVLRQLPRYQHNIIAKIRAVRSWVPREVSEASETVDRISDEIIKPSMEPTSQPTTQPTTQPAAESNNQDGSQAEGADAKSGTSEQKAAIVPAQKLKRQDVEAENANPGDGESAPKESEDKAVKVEVVGKRGAMFDQATQMLGPVVHPLVTLGIAAVFTIFFLLYRDDLRDRVIRLGGQANVHVTTTTLSDAGRRVQRYLISLGIANGINGAAIALGLFLLGVPNAIVWGLLTAMLRFVPVLGAMIAAAFPIVLSVAVADGWVVPILVAAWIFAIDQLSVNFLEPFLYGGHTGASPTAILFSFVFWTWLWGGIGLFLATPITVCLIALGRHVPAFEFFYVLFGSEPAFALRNRFYQRILANDAKGASSIVTEYVEEHGWEAAFDALIVPTCHQIQGDVEAGIFTRERIDSVRKLIDRVGGQSEEEESEVSAAEEVRPVAVVAGDGTLDAAVARNLVRRLRRAGHTGSELLDLRADASRVLNPSEGQAGPEAVVSVTLRAQSRRIQAFCGEVARRRSGTPQVVALLAPPRETQKLALRLRSVPGTTLSLKFSEAIAAVGKVTSN